jgi:hypothetical protein
MLRRVCTCAVDNTIFSAAHTSNDHECLRQTGYTLVSHAWWVCARGWHGLPWVPVVLATLVAKGLSRIDARWRGCCCIPRWRRCIARGWGRGVCRIPGMRRWWATCRRVLARLGRCGCRLKQGVPHRDGRMDAAHQTPTIEPWRARLGPPCLTTASPCVAVLAPQPILSLGLC